MLSDSFQYNASACSLRTFVIRLVPPNNVSRSHSGSKVDLPISVLSAGGGGGGSLPPNVSASPKSFPEKKFKAISNKDFFDDDFKESVKVTNVQKCDFSQS